MKRQNRQFMKFNSLLNFPGLQYLKAPERRTVIRIGGGKNYWRCNDEHASYKWPLKNGMELARKGMSALTRFKKKRK